MYNIIMYFIIAWFSFVVGFFLCAILASSKNRDYDVIIHDGENYKVKQGG